MTPEQQQAVTTWLSKIDWGLLAVQTGTIDDHMFQWSDNYTKQEVTRFTGVLNLLSSLKDLAVDSFNYPEEIVFPPREVLNPLLADPAAE